MTTPESATRLEWEHWGLIRYREALDRQMDRWARVREGRAPEAIFTLEHNPVVTLGRRAEEGHMLVPRDALEARGIDVVDVDRGGEATYHGPGQLVVYAIMDIGRRRIGPGDLVRGLAGAIQDILAARGVEAAYDPERPGLWVEDAKITAVGMRIARGVSRHGAALNVTTDLDAFRVIVPCGMPEAKTTSMATLGLEPPPLEALGREIADRFADRFGLGLD